MHSFFSWTETLQIILCIVEIPNILFILYALHNKENKNTLLKTDFKYFCLKYMNRQKMEAEVRFS